MALEVWYQSDVKRILAALASAADLYGPEYHKALSDVGLAFGLPQSQPHRLRGVALGQQLLTERGQPRECFLEALAVEWSEE